MGSNLVKLQGTPWKENFRRFSHARLSSSKIWNKRKHGKYGIFQSILIPEDHQHERRRLIQQLSARQYVKLCLNHIYKMAKNVFILEKKITLPSIILLACRSSCWCDRKCRTFIRRCSAFNSTIKTTESSCNLTNVFTATWIPTGKGIKIDEVG